VKYGVLYGSESSSSISVEKRNIPAVYIAAKDMLTHSGLEKDYIDRNLPFDITLIDILNKAGISTIKNLPKDKIAILNGIARTIDGRVLHKNDRYYTEKSDGTLIDFAAEAEGFKKLGLLYRLIETGHLNEGSVLIWDEPEANLNPKMIPIIVEILLELSRHGAQIFLATHDYSLLKYFSVKKKLGDEVAFFSLYKSTQGVLCERDEDYDLLEHNSIIEANTKLLEDEIEKVL
jgi:AAA15 family ATPase/GTPase